MLREFFYEYYFTVIILYVFCCVHKYHKKEKQNFQQLSTNNFFSKLSKFDILWGYVVLNVGLLSVGGGRVGTAGAATRGCVVARRRWGI